MTESIKTLRELVNASSSIVFFGGAGVSTESGIPDFRSTGGLYHQEWSYPPEVILSHSFIKQPRRIFPLLSGQAARAGRKAQCRPQKAGPMGEGGEAKGRCHSKY